MDGKRGPNSAIIAHGKCFVGKHRTSRISIRDGILFLNRNMSRPEPYTGVLKMQENSEINVDSTFSFYPGHHLIVMKNAKLNVGSGYINRNARIHCFKEISIGNNVSISENFTVWDSDVHIVIGSEDKTTQPVKIGNHVWIGNNVTVLKGVTIGDGAVISAGSLVNRDIPPGCLAGGVPAKVLRQSIEWK